MTRCTVCFKDQEPVPFLETSAGVAKGSVCIYQPGGKLCLLMQWEKLFSGCVAGATAILSTYPLETLRTRMAISEGKLGLWGSTTQIWQQQGVSGFYQVLLLHSLSLPECFKSYHQSKNKLLTFKKAPPI